MIGAWELAHRLDIPYKVVINEAVELAKSYGGTDGHRFVNGVLDKLAARVARRAEIAALRAGEAGRRESRAEARRARDGATLDERVRADRALLSRARRAILRSRSASATTPRSSRRRRAASSRSSVDMLVEGRHFLPDADPEALGHKTLAVNLSDLAAMGARPRWALLAGALPDADDAWLDAFARGLFALADAHRRRR